MVFVSKNGINGDRRCRSSPASLNLRFLFEHRPPKKTGLDQQTKIGWNCTRFASNLIRHTKACHDLEDDCRNLWVMWHHHLQVTQQTSVKTLYNVSVRFDTKRDFVHFVFRHAACHISYNLFTPGPTPMFKSNNRMNWIFNMNNKNNKQSHVTSTTYIINYNHIYIYGMYIVHMGK